MKRGAEKQISKLDQFSDEESEEVPSEFKKADESALATRKIRGLPKRAFAVSVADTLNGTSTSESETTVPKFTGFAGFGTQGANSAFTFTAASNKPGLAPEPPQPLATPSLGPTTTTVSTTASTTAKTLATFLGAPPDTSTQKLTSPANPSSLAFPLVKQSSQTSALSTPLSSTASDTAGESALKYFANLRGLNASFASAISKAMLEDPFVDFSQLLEQYKCKRSTIQGDYDKLKKAETSTNEKNKITTDTTQIPRPPPMPTPPTSSFSFGGAPFCASSFKSAASNAGGGFKLSLPTTTDAPSPFKFSSTISASSSESSSASSNIAAGKPAPNTSFSFGSTTTTSSPFGAKSEISNPFKFAVTSTSTTVGAAPTSGSNNLFGQQPSSSAFAKPSSTTSSSVFSVFGKPSGSGSIGNPVGFGFGANTKLSDTVDTKPATKSGFAFGQPSSPFGPFELAKGSKKTESGDDGEEEGAGDDGSGATESDEATKIEVSSPTHHDVEGEGEEGEETTHSVRLKAHRMRKPDENGGQGWIELGVGYLRLKRHKETNARRMLLRNSSTGKININFKLYSGFKVTQTKKSLTFIGHDNGVAQTYNVRLPNEDQVRELKAAIEREVALIKLQD